MGFLDSEARVILVQNGMINQTTEESKIVQLKSFLARRKEVIYLGDLSLIKNKELWGKIMDKKNMHCFRVFSPVDKNTDVPFLFKVKNPTTSKSTVKELKGDEDQSFFMKERFKEIGVHERYLEKFVKELV